ncbi:dicarboxylate/amino acid:cation symporter [Bacteroidota bacterium]
MKFKTLPLHIRIILALILGAIFGSVFNVDRSKFTIVYKKGEVVKEKIINDFKSVTYSYSSDGDEESREVRKFDAESQIQLIKFFGRLGVEERKSLVVTVTYLPKSKSNLLAQEELITEGYKNIEGIERIGTVATYIKPLGTLFINLLSFLAIPLVIATLIIGAASLEDIRKLGRIGLKTITIYITTTAIAITIGLTVANIIEPGNKIDEDSKNRLISEFQAETDKSGTDISGNPDAVMQNLDVNVVDFFLGIVPRNPINAMANGNMLQIVFFAVIFGITLTFINREKSNIVLGFFEGVSETMIKMVDFIMKIAPYGVFALISATIAEFGFGIISTLIWYIAAVILGLIIHTVVVYPILVKTFGRMSPVKYFKGIRNAQAIGFSTSSSAATLPVTLDCAEKNLGVPKHISGFVLPLGATINMDGTALYQGVAAVFIAQVYGFDLNIIQQLTIVLTAVLASIGTAPVPGVGIIMLVMILNAIHIPAEGIALILGVDRILDMCRTITNVSGDAAVAVAIAGSEEGRKLKKAP